VDISITALFISPFQDAITLGKPVEGIRFPHWNTAIPEKTEKRGVINLADSGLGRNRKETEKLSLAFNSFVKQTGEPVNLRYLEDLTKCEWAVFCQDGKRHAIVLRERHGGPIRPMIKARSPLLCPYRRRRSDRGKLRPDMVHVVNPVRVFYLSQPIGGFMFTEHNQIQKKLDNAKAGITIRLNETPRGEQGEQEERDPFEVTVFFKKPGKTETPDSEAVSLTATGKLRLTIGQKGFIEIFAENTGVLHSGDSRQSSADFQSPEEETE
jgi:hypothetical protein